MNKVFFNGRLTREPEQREVQSSNTTVVFIDVAVETGTKDNPAPMYYHVSVWGKQAENAMKYLHKGDAVVISGDLKQSEYKKKNGENAIQLNVNNAQYQMMSSRRTEAGETYANTQAKETYADDDDDLPF